MTWSDASVSPACLGVGPGICACAGLTDPEQAVKSTVQNLCQATCNG